MSQMLWFGLPSYEIAIPIVVWIIIVGHHMWLVRKHHIFSVKYTADVAPSVYSFFSQVRTGWIKQNHLTGQSSANSTRDYLRVLLFYAGNACILSTITAGYCASSYKPDGTPYDHLLTAKLGSLAILFLVIFFVMIYALRYGTHFHMIMNVKEVNGYLLSTQLSVIERVYDKSHFFYSSGVRLFFLMIPAFGWLVNCWVMLAICPLHMIVVKQYDDIQWLQKDIDLLFKKGEGAEQELPLLDRGGAAARDPKNAV